MEGVYGRGALDDDDEEAGAELAAAPVVLTRLNAFAGAKMSASISERRPISAAPW
jgi:hypothetical protein